MPISPTQFQEMLARTARNPAREPSDSKPVERENDLHDAIIQLCKDRGWYYVHSRTDRRTTQACGVPDFIIATEIYTVWLECKAKTGKATIEQLAAITHLKKLGHTAEIVSSMADVFKTLADVGVQPTRSE